MLTDATPRKANRAAFLESDRIRTLDLPQDGCLLPIAKGIESAMKNGTSADVRRACEEFCHHLDFQKFGFRDSWHTRGFYERAAELYHYARGTPPKKLFWVPVAGGRWRIDWQRTNRAVAVFGDATLD